jgi:hypothetical protein
MKQLMTVLCILFLVGGADAQQKTTSKKKVGAKAGKVKSAKKRKAKAFRPTWAYGEGSIGRYFYPHQIGSSWTMRTTSAMFDASNTVIGTDTMINTERVLSDTNRSLQGLPILIVESSSRRLRGDTTAKVEYVQYYVDDSIVMAIINNSVTSADNKTLLVSPLKVGTAWKESIDDTAHARIVSLSEPVQTAYGSWDKSVVVSTKLGKGELAKYFVKDVGLVKVQFRGPGRNDVGAYVVTTELTNPKEVLVGDKLMQNERSELTGKKHVSSQTR